MGLFTNEELMLMIGVVGVLLLCISVLTIFDIKEYLKSRKKVDVSEDIKEKVIVKDEPKEEVAAPTVSSLNVQDEVLISDIKEEKISEDDIFLEEIEDVEEESNENVSLVTENVALSEIVENNPVIEKEEPVAKKRLDLYEELDNAVTNLPNEKDDLTNFELEQERTAIISLDELLKRSNELYNDNEIVQYDDGDEPITIDEVINRYNKINNINEEASVPEVMQDIVESKVEPYSKKETIPFISSVYGIEKQDNSLEFENTASYEKLDRANNKDFVSKLREMNENK